MPVRVILGRRSFARPRGLRILLYTAGVVVPIANLPMPAMNELTTVREIAERKSDGGASVAADTAPKRRQHSPPPTTDAT